jgi:hypothetical protein
MKIQVTLTLFNKPITETYHDPEFDPVLCPNVVNRLLELSPHGPYPPVVIAELSNESFDGATEFVRNSVLEVSSAKFYWNLSMFKWARKYLSQIQVIRPGQTFYLKITLP